MRERDDVLALKLQLHRMLLSLRLALPAPRRTRSPARLPTPSTKLIRRRHNLCRSQPSRIRPCTLLLTRSQRRFNAQTRQTPTAQAVPPSNGPRSHFLRVRERVEELVGSFEDGRGGGGHLGEVGGGRGGEVAGEGGAGTVRGVGGEVERRGKVDPL